MVEPAKLSYPVEVATVGIVYDPRLIVIKVHVAVRGEECVCHHSSFAVESAAIAMVT